MGMGMGITRKAATEMIGNEEFGVEMNQPPSDVFDSNCSRQFETFSSTAFS